MLSRFGPESSEKLADVHARIVDEVRSYLSGRVPMPAIALVQAPVFHSQTFTVFALFKALRDFKELTDRLQRAGLKVITYGEEPPNNINVVGEGRPVLGPPERDRGIENGVWLWGAADNLRVPVTTAVAIAEKLLAS